MNGIVINIDPILFHAGGFALRWYSVAIMAAFVAGITVAVHQGKKKGLPDDFIYSLAPWAILAGLVGARLFHVIDRWEYYAVNPLYILQVQQGGLAIWGGVVAGGGAGVIYARARKVPVLRFLDVMVPALLAAQIVGRVGCIINGDAYGGITGLPWGFIYTNPNALIPRSLASLPTHPYPVYEMIWNGATLFILTRLHRRFGREGLLFFCYLAFYSVGRLLLTFVRQEANVFGLLQQAQLIAIVSLVISVAAVAWLTRGPKKATADTRA